MFLQNLRYEKYLKISPKYIHDFMYYCTCMHPEYNHHEFNNFICSYSGEYCECSGLTPLNLHFNIIITNIDRFEFEVKDHSERDSFSYWNEFHLWRIQNENKESHILYGN